MGEYLLGDIFGWIGLVISIFFYMAPVAPFINLIKGRITYKETPGILLFCSFLNCLLWAVYGIKLNKTQIFITNGVGGVITLVWIFIFIIYFAKKSVFKSIIFIFLTLVIPARIFSLFYFVIDHEKNKAEITGYSAMLFNVLMYAAPGEKIYTVIKTGNYKLIPIFSTIAAFFNSICWLMYGIYQSDINIIIPNGMGFFFAILQVGTYLIIKFDKYQEKKIKKNIKSNNVPKINMKEKIKSNNPKGNTIVNNEGDQSMVIIKLESERMIINKS